MFGGVLLALFGLLWCINTATVHTTYITAPLASKTHSNRGGWELVAMVDGRAEAIHVENEQWVKAELGQALTLEKRKGCMWTTYKMP